MKNLDENERGNIGKLDSLDTKKKLKTLQALIGKKDEMRQELEEDEESREAKLLKSSLSLMIRGQVQRKLDEDEFIEIKGEKNFCQKLFDV